MEIVVVSDTNIFIDLYNVDLLDEFFSLDIEIHTTDFVMNELIVEKHKDNNFIECLKSLVGMKMNTDNILNIYDYCQYLNSYNKT